MATITKIADARAQSNEVEALRTRLKDIIRERSFSDGVTRRLASGRTSSFYFNMKRTMSQPEGLHLIAELMFRELQAEKCDYVGGLEMGAVPILNAISLRSFEKGSPIPLFWIRKEAKAHGTMELLEGEDVDNLKGKTAVMVEDVTTSGGSVLQAIEEARKHGIKISTVVTIVDRMEGAKERLAERGVKLKSLFNTDDFRV